MNIVEILKKNIYTLDKHSIGQTIISGKGLDLILPTKSNFKLVTEYVINEINKALNISKKYNKTTTNVHIYLKDITFKNVNISLYKRLVKTLNETFEETLNCCYIYDLSKLGSVAWKIIKIFLDPVTRKKIILLKS